MTDKIYKVLVAEDDKFLVKAFKSKLERNGFDVIMASDGNDAIIKVKKEKPDIILLDLMMPVKSGFEVLEELKLDDDLKKIPVIILSNLGQDTDIKKGIDLGAIDYLVKADLSISAVVEKVRENLVKSRK